MYKLLSGLVILLFGFSVVTIAQPAKRAQEKAYYSADYKHAADFVGNRDGTAS